MLRLMLDGMGDVTAGQVLRLACRINKVGRLFGGVSGVGIHDVDIALRLRRGSRCAVIIEHTAIGDDVKPSDQVFVCPLRLRLLGLESRKDFLDAVQRLENHGHRFRCDLDFLVPDLAQNILRGVGDGLQPRQPQKTAGALDGVHQAEDIL